MQDQSELVWVFAPLDKVPRRTIVRLTEKLRKSSDSSEKAVGIFLDRVLAHQDGKTSKKRVVKDSRDPRLSSLRDLRD